METYNDYLQHWGILGMKWGKRNGPPYPLSSSQMNASERRQKKLKDNVSKQEKKNKKVKEMSDEELNSSINRMRKEREYQELSKSSITNGKKFVSALLIAGGTAAATAMVTNLSRNMSDNALRKISNAFTSKDKKEYISELKNQFKSKSTKELVEMAQREQLYKTLIKAYVSEKYD